MNKNNDFRVSISLITTCKGRLYYLKKVLPSWLALNYDNYDIIVVDYDDPDGTEEYIKKNKRRLLKGSKCKDIKVVKVSNKPYFNLNDARNKGIEASDSELIFMIDSDIFIKSRKILQIINIEYQKGTVFWSTFPVFTSLYKEVSDYYEDEFKVKIGYLAILPFVSVKRDLTGTVCFLRKNWEMSGKYNTKINEKGYGFDDREFYLRYLNITFFEDYTGKNPEKSILCRMSEVFLDKIKVFKYYELREIPNRVDERGRFYPNSSRDTNFENKSFIRDFFEGFYVKIGISKNYFIKIKKTESVFYRLKSKNKWLVPYIYFIIGIKRWNLKDYKKSIFFLKKSLRANNYKIPHFRLLRIKTLFKIHIVKKYGEGKDCNRCLVEIIDTLSKKKRKNEIEYKLLLDSFFELRRKEDFIKLGKKIIANKKFDPDFKFSVIFKMAVFREEMNGSKDYFKKALKLLESFKKDRINIHRKASILKHLGRYNEAIKLYKDLLNYGSDENFKANINFHIGEIYYIQNQKNKAKKYLLIACKLNPFHRKAKEYLKSLGN